MNKIVLPVFATFVITIIGCHNGNNSGSNTSGFTINGTIKNMDSGWAYLQHEDSIGFVLDSAKIQNHAFIFTGKVSEPALYHLWAGQGAYYVSHSGLKKVNPKSLALFVEDTTIQLDVKDTINKAVVSGTPSENVYLAYKKAMAPIAMKEHILDAGYDRADESKDKILIDSLDKASDQLTKEKDIAIAAFAESNANSIVSAWAIAANALFEPDLETLKKVYASFSPSVQQSSYGKKIKDAIDLNERLGIGQVAPDFIQNDTAGNPVSLSSLRGKYVLVDFWAAWCPDCRRENPNVVLIYNKYKDRNFTVLGVSLDSKKANWLKVIHDDGLAWTQVSDLKLWKNKVATMYGIRSIPSNYLLDPNGKIIGHDLIGEDLDKALAKVIR